MLRGTLIWKLKEKVTVESRDADPYIAANDTGHGLFVNIG